MCHVRVPCSLSVAYEALVLNPSLSPVYSHTNLGRYLGHIHFEHLGLSSWHQDLSAAIVLSLGVCSALISSWVSSFMYSFND